MSRADIGSMTLREACTLIVGMLGDEATVPNVCRFLAADGAPHSRASVRRTLHERRGATVEIAVQGDRSRPSRWRPTEATSAWLKGECGESRCAP